MKRLAFFLGFAVCADAGLMDFKTIEAANKAYEKEEYQKSAVLLEGLEKRSSELEYDKANAYYKTKQYDKALESYNKAQGVNEAYRKHNIGNSYFQQQKYDEAIKAYEEALKVKDDPQTHANLELAKKRKKEQQQSKQEQQKKEEQKKEQKQNSQEDQNQTQKNNSSNDPKEQNSKEQNSNEQKPEQQKKGEQQQKEQQPKSQKPQEDQSGKNEKQEQDNTGEKDMQTPEEKEQAMTQKEVEGLLKQLGQKKMPAMMYQATDPKKGESGEEVNPW